jgi:hypothetical protein
VHAGEVHGHRPFAAVHARPHVLFGATILGCAPNRAARALLDLYNGRGVFNNSADNLKGLEAGPWQRFAKVEIELQGCVGPVSRHVN